MTEAQGAEKGFDGAKLAERIVERAAKRASTHEVKRVLKKTPSKSSK